jgi:molybdate/tungstate transport system substrate-binding protein
MVRIFALLLASAFVAAAPPQTVSVLYAGSLVTPMEGPIAQTLARRNVTFEGEARGSQALVNLVLAGLRKPDVVIVVGSDSLARVTRAGLVAQSWTLGSASLGLSWTQQSFYANRLATASPTQASLLALFQIPGLRIARTDPQLDPKGRYTVLAMKTLFASAREHAILGDDENPAQVFPEQDLLVRLEAGEADVGFVYSTEARARHFPFIALPGRASMSDEIRFYVAVMKRAPHPAAARTFANFLLHGEGRTILRAAGLATGAMGQP